MDSIKWYKRGWVKWPSTIAVLFIIHLIWIMPRPLFNKPLSTALYDENGDLLGAHIAKDGQWRFPQLDSLPQKYIDCLIAYEDHRYYYHIGVDPFSLLGAAKYNLTSKSRRGGSTITMQVMRMALSNQRRNIWSKVKEMFLAVYLTMSYSKTSVLKLYASNAPYGGNVVGLEAACWRYYGKNPSLITWAEAATLAVLPNAPSLIHVGKNRDLLKRKRDNLLLVLKEKGMLDQETYQLSKEEPLPDQPKALPALTPHLVDRVNKLHRNGIRMKTSIDREIQDISNEIATYHQTILAQNNIRNLAILILENKTGRVKAYVGNAPNTTLSKHVDMIQAKRSSGSILKPFLYTASLHEGQLTPQAILSDIPIFINGYAPQNFDKSYRGAVSADEALQRSLNVPFVLQLRQFGINKFLLLNKKLGITTLNRTADNYGLSLILGGGEVNLWELCGVYASMARVLTHYTSHDSKYNKHDWHAPIIDAEWSPPKGLWAYEPTIYNAGSIYQCFEALKSLKRPDEEGRWEEFNSSRTLAWKTGTSFGHKDAWAIGVDATYTIGIWVGNADGTSRANLTGITVAAPILFDVFNRMPHSQWFQTPWDDLSSEVICRHSGAIAQDHCTLSDTLYINASSKNTLPCPYHKSLAVTNDGLYQALQSCVSTDNIIAKSFFILPPDEVAYYKPHHADYVNVPDFHPDCIASMDARNLDQIAIIFPRENTKIFIGTDVSGKAQSVIFKASHNRENGILYWHIDNQYMGKTMTYHTLDIVPNYGKHLLTIMDENGQKKSTFFEIISKN